MMVTRYFIVATLVGALGLGGGALGAGDVLVRAALELHGGPNNSFAVEGTLPAGTRIRILWCNATADWCVVRSGEAQGWAPFTYLEPGANNAGEDAHAVAASAAGSAPPMSLTSGGSAAGAAGALSLNGKVGSGSGTIAAKLR